MDSERPPKSTAEGGTAPSVNTVALKTSSDVIFGTPNEPVAKNVLLSSAEPRNTGTGPEAEAEKALLGVGKSEYGDDYNKHVVELYKVFVDSADKISARRVTANSFFLTLNSALVGLLTL